MKVALILFIGLGVIVFLQGRMIAANNALREALRKHSPEMEPVIFTRRDVFPHKPGQVAWVPISIPALFALSSRTLHAEVKEKLQAARLAALVTVGAALGVAAAVAYEILPKYGSAG